ncbi:hypothetical protein MGG_15828 [Pyricularia oryzae 70-15]|uniref:Uncharacterized protein n=2 Tax=Pyricularia oryzae TaxID=318829 RepID=G4MYT0_PYRO7|nr:uncharacterized protein MGG_15828 [Pyricularia oryzae 70-15]EHA55309.1 hypothetical protein MGG_15828 [Pyricularia oryzae 70-15]KAI7924451.1 hypothetical protein M0657_004617 [Pyricularia oryzae]KAI7926226.1 hypothetical protein M9X92_002816 [Pyricularia oryzae]QBZ56991.1 hypothetical protein PoMZ_01909 [Pyricularia oryzae]
MFSQLRDFGCTKLGWGDGRWLPTRRAKPPQKAVGNMILVPRTQHNPTRASVSISILRKGWV